MMAREKFEVIRTKAIECEKRGACKLWGNSEYKIGVDWTLETPEHFLIAKELVRMADDFDDCPACEEDGVYYIQSDEFYEDMTIIISDVFI